MSSSDMNVVKTSKSVNDWIESKQGNLQKECLYNYGQIDLNFIKVG